MEFLYNVDFFNTDFINNDVVVLTLGLGAALFFGSLIYFKFLKNWPTSGDDSASSVAEEITIKGVNTDGSSTVKGINDPLHRLSDSDLISNVGTDYYSIGGETVQANISTVDVGVNTDYSNFFNGAIFNKFFAFFRSESSQSGSFTFNSSPIDSELKHQQLEKFLGELNNNSFTVDNSPVKTIDLNSLTSSDIKFLSEIPKTSPINVTDILSMDNVSDVILDAEILPANIPLPDTIINTPISANVINVDAVISPVDVPLPDSPFSEVNSYILSMMNNTPEILVNGAVSTGELNTIASVSEAIDAATVIGQCFSWSLSIML